MKNKDKKKKYQFDDGFVDEDVDYFEPDDYDGKDIGSATYEELQLQNLP